MTADAMLPCPFCGHTSVVYSAQFRRVRCNNCFMGSYLGPREQCVAAWNTRPTPQTPGDVVEAVKRKFLAVISNDPDCTNSLEVLTDGQFTEHEFTDAMQAALNAAAAMGYHLAPDERTLPELPQGWEISNLCSVWHKTNEVLKWHCKIVQNRTQPDSYMVVSEGPTPRAAVLAALARITLMEEGKE